MDRSTALCAVALGSLIPAIASADSLSLEERTAIDRRLVHMVEPKATLAIEEGDTVFIERRESVPAKRFSKKLTDYEATVIGIGAPKGVVVHARIDEARFEPAPGDKVVVTFRYAIHVDPGTKSGGRLQLTLAINERTGLANTIDQTKVTFGVTIAQPKTKPQELAADFYGYRLYQGLTVQKIDQLKKAGVGGLSIADQGRIPPLDRAGPEVVQAVYAFERDRRRMWVAHRHLITARTSKNEKISSLAKAYLANLDKPADQLSGAPTVAIVGDGPKIPGASQPQAQAQVQEQTETLKPERVETLKPERVESAEPGGAPAKGGATGTLSPVGAYEQGTDTDEDEPFAETPPPREELPKAPKSVAKPAGDQLASAGTPGEEPGTARASGGIGEIDRLQDDLLTGRGGRLVIIPSYPRTLTLDDPNIAHGVAVRFNWATIDLKGTNGVAPAIFYHGQVAATRYLGLELTVPTAYISVDVSRAQSIYVMGNPLLALKYRFHLPAVEGRQPALTVRARWGIPISPLNTIPPTQLGAEEFSFQAHFVDTYAFLLEKTDIGFGINGAWQANIVHIGLQFYTDYFIPVSNAIDQTSFPTLSYGASVGVLPFGDVAGAYLEGRATTLISGPTRTEFFTYLGVRGRFLEYMEAAAWGSLPIGSVGRISGLQFGLELRFAYDMPDAITIGGGRDRDVRPFE